MRLDAVPLDTTDVVLNDPGCVFPAGVQIRIRRDLAPTVLPDFIVVELLSNSPTLRTGAIGELPPHLEVIL